MGGKGEGKAKSGEEEEIKKEDGEFWRRMKKRAKEKRNKKEKREKEKIRRKKGRETR